MWQSDLHVRNKEFPFQVNLKNKTKIQTNKQKPKQTNKNSRMLCIKMQKSNNTWANGYGRKLTENHNQIGMRPSKTA
jgi:hypothetical protein